MRIAVVGTGAAGLAAAWLLAGPHEVVVYEAERRPGGHCHTVEVPWRGGSIPVDTGFIVYNERNYPNLTQWFRVLGVATEDSEMSFSVHFDDGRLEYAGTNLLTLFAQPANLLRPAYLGMLADVLRFNRRAPGDLAAGRLEGRSLGDYLAAGRYGRAMREWYLLPMGAAIWSSSYERMLAFPAAHFVRFFANHGLLTVNDRPQWRTVTGGSRRYVERVVAGLRERLRLGAAVRRIARDGSGVTLTDETGQSDRFDHVVLATHADQALGLLAMPADDERRTLGAFRYQANDVLLHRDGGQMPRRRRAWSSWNYQARADGDATAEVSLTYWMNRLQNLDPACPLFVSVNPLKPPPEASVLGRYSYLHPLFDRATDAAQPGLAALQGRRRTWFCGSYFGYGFHEDAFESGLEVAEALGGLARPWPVAGRRILSPPPPPLAGAHLGEAAE